MRITFINRKKLFLPGFLLVLTIARGFAQESIPGTPIICYPATTHSSSHVTHSPANLRLQQATANFDVTYVGFPEAAKKAFAQAVTIWETSIQSSIPIRITATWTNLDGNALASTKASKLYRSFGGAISPDIWYPVALAEKLADRELNAANEADIQIAVNQAMNWYFGTDGDTPANQLDLVSIVLHEIAHGLGFTSAAHVDNDFGILRDEKYLLIYDVLLENNRQQRLSTFADSTRELYAQFTSDALYLRSPRAAAVNQGQFPKVFAPGFFNSGSSMSHLDESTYEPGDSNSLMTPSFSIGESIHVLGEVTLGVLADLGWTDRTQLASEVVLFPNPSTGIYYVRLPINLSAVGFRVVDVLGREITRRASMEAGPVPNIDLTGLSKGMYGVIISVQNGNTTEEIKKTVIVSR